LRELEALAKRVRRHVIAMTAAAGSGGLTPEKIAEAARGVLARKGH